MLRVRARARPYRNGGSSSRPIRTLAPEVRRASHFAPVGRAAYGELVSGEGASHLRHAGQASLMTVDYQLPLAPPPPDEPPPKSVDDESLLLSDVLELPAVPPITQS